MLICRQYQCILFTQGKRKEGKVGRVWQCDVTARQHYLCSRMHKNWQRLIHDYACAAVTTAIHIFFTLSFFLLSPLLFFLSVSFPFRLLICYKFPKKWLLQLVFSARWKSITLIGNSKRKYCDLKLQIHAFQKMWWENAATAFYSQLWNQSC